MEFDLEDFVKQPSLDLFHKCTKDNLVDIADHYNVKVQSTKAKKTLKAELWVALFGKGILPDPGTAASPAKPVVLDPNMAASPVKSDEIRKLELELEMRRLELQDKDKERAAKLKEQELQHNATVELKRMELEQTKQEICLKELQLKQASAPHVSAQQSDYDVNKCIRLIPPFNSKDVDKYFTLFERTADTLKWPRKVWPLLLQCVLTGKAQEAYASLSPDDSLDYAKVKAAVLRAFELVPEAYRQKFRRFKKLDNQTFAEFGREKEALFDRWCQSSKVTHFNQLRELILLEEFKNCLPDKVATYINEQKATTLSAATVLADEYVLTHKDSFDKTNGSKPPWRKPNSSHSDKPNTTHDSALKREGGEKLDKSEGGEGTQERPTCNYCKKVGHTRNRCYALKNKSQSQSTKEVALIKSQPSSPPVAGEPVRSPDPDFQPFLMKGFVSLSEGDPMVPVSIIRDTASNQSVILQHVLPFSDKSAVKSDVLVRGFDMQYVGLPLHNIYLDCDLVKGSVRVGLRSQLPIEGVTLLLGNDLAGGKMLINPEVISVPLPETTDDLALKFPKVFSACAMTRAMAERQKLEAEVELSDSFLVDCAAAPPVSPEVPTDSVLLPQIDSKKCMSREQLVADQKRDVSLTPLFDSVVSGEGLEDLSTGFFLKGEVLMRKWTPPRLSGHEGWGAVEQIVIPQVYRGEVLRLAHDNPLSGHLGINKTFDRILRYFFWPGLKADVRHHCKTCHVCQVAKSQPISPYPLCPIPVIGEPFDRVQIDCVGPLPRTKSGNKFLLTIMCTATRFPEAIPLRSITAPAVVKALVKFFSTFGLPRKVQSDQGSNFMSRVFAQVMKQLNITHVCSSAYHPESQGAIERFHRTLKDMLRSYCFEFEKDWDEGVPLLLFAVREVVQESLGFSPAELVFAHTVRGPLRLLQEKWLGDSKPQNLLDYVSKFRFRLHRACELAKENMTVAQGKMKRLFDQDAKSRSFNPGDKVLVLLPIPGSALQARYSGPYLVKKKVGDRDYIIDTPERRRRSRLCHINMLKPYFDREPQPGSNSSDGADVSVPPVLSGDIGDPDKVTLALSIDASVPPPDSHDDQDDIVGVSTDVTHGRLKNSEMLANLHDCLPNLVQYQREDVISLIRSNPNLFSDVPTRTHVLQHDIDVGNSPPIKQHAYRVNPDKRLRLQKQVNYMLENGIAIPSTSAWSSPCLLAAKSDGSDRFCTDYRKVNGVTKPDCFPLPRIDDCVDKVGHAKFVTKLDLLKGYWQVPLTPRAQAISAFVTPDAFLEYTVMPFGVRNAPATFQRLVNTVLSGLPGCEAYLDDIVVYSSTWDDHIQQLRAVFDRLGEANLTLNLAKCEFGQATVTYLGKVVGRGQVKPVHSKVEAILSFPPPVTRRGLMRFLGMAGYYRSFCRNFSAVAAPLTDLLSPKVRYKWSPSCQHSFDGVKALLTSAPVLAAPAFERPFKIAVDACDSGAGAVLLQDGDDGIEHPVSYYSKKFNRHQRVYSTVEKEALALILALKHFEVYVGSSNEPTLVYTDHNPLVFLNQMRNTNRRLMRWSLFMQCFNVEVKHVRGKDNVLADTLSRSFSDE